MLPIARTDAVPRAPIDAGARGRPASLVIPDRRVERLAAGVLRRYLRATAARSRVIYADARGDVLDAGAVETRLERLLAPAEPLIVTYWIEDALAVAVLPLVHRGFARMLSTVTCVVDDTFAGRVAGRYIDAMSGRYALLALPGNPDRLSQVHALMKRRSSCAFPVDGGGPYHEVGTGIITLALSLRASIVPIAGVARPALPAVHASRVRLPLPKSTIAVAIGDRLIVQRDEDRQAATLRLRAMLDEAGAAVRSVLRRCAV